MGKRGFEISKGMQSVLDFVGRYDAETERF